MIERMENGAQAAADGTTVAGNTTSADQAPVDPGATPDLSSLVGGAPEPVDAAGGPVERAIAELSSADIDRWLDELVRDAFGDAPAPGEPGRPPQADGWDIGGWHDPGEWLDARDPDPPGGDPVSPAPDTP